MTELNRNNDPIQNRVKSFQEVSEEVKENQIAKNMQPTPQPKEFTEIEY